MQNIDYSRRLRGSAGFASPTQEFQYPPSQPAPSYYAKETTKPKSAFILLIGAILLFTAGMVVGIQLNQKEKGFQTNQEKSFSNVGRNSGNSTVKSEPTDTGNENNIRSTSSSDAAATSPFPTSLKFPPKNDQINYMVQIGNFSPEEAIQVGKQLMMSVPSLQGRIFRTSTGKLYAGYYYRMEDAREALSNISGKLPNPSEATVKTIRF